MRREADTQCPRLFPQRMHKTASKYPHVVYPVAEREQRFEDTSFGVALNALHRQGVVEERARGSHVGVRSIPRGGGFRSGYANAGPAAFGKSYSADRAIQDARGDEGEARSSTRETSPKVGIPAFLHLIIQSQAGCQAC